MRVHDVVDLVQGTSDSAFAVDGAGLIVSWNRAAEELFGIPSDEAVGSACGDILQGQDECGPVCSRECTVRQSVSKGRPVRNFDLRLKTKEGWRWCNLSVLIAGVPPSPYAIHIVRLIDTPKRLEMLVRDFLVGETNLPVQQAASLISSRRTAASDCDLTKRELEILRLLAKGDSTARIAEQLHISRTTVNNHIQHIHRKLNSHTRLEAVRRAEHAGLISARGWSESSE
ncbi:MAG: LuxR C-terminal-related transcriptional regulator [Acidobacteriota bacterium]